MERFEIQVAEPPFDVDTDIEAKGYWLRPVGNSAQARVRMLRKQVLIGLISMLEQATRVGPSLIVGVGQGGLLSAVASSPLLVEQACRYRMVTPEEMARYRVVWSKVLGLVSIDPEVVKQRSDLDMLKQGRFRRIPLGRKPWREH